MGKIKAAVVGVGNCFAGLVEGIEYYRRNPERKITGIMHENMGGYSIFDIDFVAAFDISKDKVGKPLHEAVFSGSNKVRWVDSIQESNTIVKQSPRLDGVSKYVEKEFNPVNDRPLEELKKEISEELKRTGTEVIISYLPVGSQKATEFWANMALETGAAFVNCMPAFIASNPAWAKRFEEKNLPVVGDDIKGMVGATIVHRVLAKMVDDRGAEIIDTYQLNVGGNTDFLNMLERERLKSKKISKTESVQSQLSKRLPEDKIYVGPSDFVPFLNNTKLCFLRIDGRMWADVPFNIELRLQVDDKANSGGIAIDAIRAAKIALDRGIGGPIESASAYLMKHPPKQMSDSEARIALEEFIAGKRER